MNTAGRKQWDGKDEAVVIPKLEAAFAIDCTVGEACFYASISTSSYYRFIENNTQFRDRFNQLRNTPVIAARQTVVNALKEDPHLALKYLERKRKEEFSTRRNIGIKEATDFDNLSDEELKKIATIHF